MIPPILGAKSWDPSKKRTWEPCCFVHSRRTRYCADWDFVNDTTQQYARMDMLHIAPAPPDDSVGRGRFGFACAERRERR